MRRVLCLRATRAILDWTPPAPWAVAVTGIGAWGQVSKSQLDGDRLREAQSINKSLSALVTPPTPFPTALACVPPCRRPSASHTNRNLLSGRRCGRHTRQAVAYPVPELQADFPAGRRPRQTRQSGPTHSPPMPPDPEASMSTPTAFVVALSALVVAPSALVVALSALCSSCPPHRHAPH